VSDLADLDRLYQTVKGERGSLDIILANAGTGEVVPLGEITPEHYARTFDVNVKGLLFTVQKGLPLMRAGGSIILTGSTTGEMEPPASASIAPRRPRCATSHAVGRRICAARASE
jgi:NAD(P)-dependent dehydrogenase (short-subunit alcohol dehydrogenase family)